MHSHPRRLLNKHFCPSLWPLRLFTLLCRRPPRYPHLRSTVEILGIPRPCSHPKALIGHPAASQVSPKHTEIMPPRGFGKRKGGYKGPLPGPEKNDAEGERSGVAQKPAKKPPLTHFLCVPLVTTESKPQLQASLQNFKEAVLCQEDVDLAGDGASGGIPERAIRPVGTLHLTLGVMSLQSPEKVEEAVSLLQSLDLVALLRESQPTDPVTADADSTSSHAEMARATIPPQPESGKTSVLDASTTRDQPPVPGPTDPLAISLRSLVSMHPPGKTSILYAQPEDPTGRLYSFCAGLRRLFTEKGLMVEDTRPLKLHATIVNTIYAKAGGRHGKGTSAGHGPNARAPVRIDATSLLPNYADYVWADSIHVGKIAICKMGAKKILDAQGSVVSEEYEQVASAEIKV